MKSLFFAIVLIAQTAMADVATKTLVYCDYATENTSIYMDLYFDYDATKDAYSTPEMGVVVDETSAYPDYLWNVTATYNQTEVIVANEKDGNSVIFSLASNGASTPSIVLNKSNGFVADFNLPFTAQYNGESINAEFLCYDPAAQAPQENAVR
jgi:IMP cyclohydrolase